ncbi:DUF4394 domain-containing protein [Streptomyces fructofermentans]|uniref:DUF4394 domain-containing protein n=1 Tax=Streptomyces fructofermentans TaxID=152141 RepID=A0A918NFF3_9ACTN|nr:DUF4394 domain-containing protein [Streptomyces fructofermentans]GGX63305.1 hypothetical protein GCM10010515_33710 [Streptomyces fructofermentans]
MRKVAVVLALAAVAAAAVPAAGAAPDRADDRWVGTGKGLVTVGLTTDQRLVAFRTQTPGETWNLGRITGLRGDDRLVGIDFRVQDKRLYGVGNRGGVYTVSSAAKAVKASQLTVGLSGRNFGVDFNPAADRLRVISDNGQNLRHRLDAPGVRGATVADIALTNSTRPPSRATGVSGAAYTNNDLDPATGTTLFDIDTLNDRVSLQYPANAGTLAPIGTLGVNAGPAAGFDIFHKPKDGTNSGFAALKTGGAYRFYRIDLLGGGTAHFVGAFPAARQVFDIALPFRQD